jgi:hypothetical protein
MNAQLQALVWRRAGFRCEYCHFPVDFAKAPFEIDHIIAQKHRGETVAENLALSCYYCNSYKGPNVAGVDPLEGRIVRLFHPRKDVWAEHFAWNGPVLIGISGFGRATIEVLEMNRADVIEVRRVLLEASVSFD